MTFPGRAAGDERDDPTMPYAYMLECSDGSYYVGSTWDLERRVSEHNLGVGAAYTRRRRPVRLVWCEWTTSMEAAYRYEKQVQGWSRAKRQALIEGRYDVLRTLASRARTEPEGSTGSAE